MDNHKRPRTEALDDGVLTQISNHEEEDDPNSQMKLKDPYGNASHAFDPIEDPDDDRIAAIQLDPRFSYTAICLVSVGRIAFVPRTRMSASGHEEALQKMPLPCNGSGHTTPDQCPYFKWYMTFFKSNWQQIITDGRVEVFHLKGISAKLNGRFEDMYIVNPCVCDAWQRTAP